MSITVPSEKITIDRSKLVGSGSTSRVYRGDYKEGELTRHKVAI